MAYESVKQQVIDACRFLLSSGLLRGTSGNVSIRCDADTIAVSPSGIPYDTLTVDDIPLVDPNGNVKEGSKKPSSETPMHTIIYRNREDVGAVVHCHALYSTAFSASKHTKLPVVTVPIIRYDPVYVAPFEVPGSKELAESTMKYLGQTGSALILQHHGIITACANIDKALTCCSYVEEAAQAAFIAYQLTDEPSEIPQEVVDMLMHRVRQGGAI